MITCPWCGTNYETFQSNCDNCGGSLPMLAESASVPDEPVMAQEVLLSPPLPPREVPKKVFSRILFTDAAAITGGIFLLLGSIFFIVGVPLVIAIITSPVGIPFAGLGFIFLVVGGILFSRSYQKAQQIVDILSSGQAALGEIRNVSQNYNVRINNRFPWVIEYQFSIHGQNYQGMLNTLSQPDLSQQPGRAVYVLYQLDDPDKNTLYPSPYGYYGL